MEETEAVMVITEAHDPWKRMIQEAHDPWIELICDVGEGATMHTISAGI
jgi:hypothetical protein